MADCLHCKEPIPTTKKSRGKPYIYCSNPCRYAGERAKRHAKGGWNFIINGATSLSPYRRVAGD